MQVYENVNAISERISTHAFIFQNNCSGDFSKKLCIYELYPLCIHFCLVLFQISKFHLNTTLTSVLLAVHFNQTKIMCYLISISKKKTQLPSCVCVLWWKKYLYKSLSEAPIFASTNPQCDDRLFIELQVQYMKNPSSNLGRTCCLQKLFLTFRTIFVHNMFSPCSEKDLPVCMYK